MLYFSFQVHAKQTVSYLFLLYLAVLSHTVVVTSPLEDCRQTGIYWDRVDLLFVGGNTASSGFDVKIPEKSFRIFTNNTIQTSIKISALYHTIQRLSDMSGCLF